MATDPIIPRGVTPSNLAVTNATNAAAVVRPVASAKPPVVSWSHFYDPLLTAPNRLSGRSRAAGDASPEVKQRVRELIVAEAARQRMSCTETYFAIAVATLESGMNPDAAARASSASGVGQLIDGTAQALGIPNRERFDARESVRGMITYLQRALLRARQVLGTEANDTSIFARAYGYYHDGLASSGRSGEQIARRHLNTADAALDCSAARLH